MRRGSSRLLTLGILLILSILVVVAGLRSGLAQPVINALMVPLSPLMGLLTSGTDATLDLFNKPQDYAALQQRTRELERLLAELQVEVVRLREIERDYYRLSGLVNYAAAHPDQGLVTADVIARDTSGYLRWVIINRGTRDGIREGNPVINERGLVGRVERVAANAAWVRLAIDQASAINAILQESRAEGTVIGQLQGNLRMELIPQEAVVKEGDLVLTSGLGGTFPPNIVIGQVVSVQRQQAALFQEAEVRPSVDFNDLRIVSVITTFQPLDLTIFEEAEGGGAP